MTSKEAYIVLNMLQEVGPVRVRRLLEQFGRPEKILEASRSELLRVDGIGEEVVRSITSWREQADLDAELKRIEQAGARVVTCDDADYPKNLRQIYDPPLVLYVKGELSERDAFSIALVGTRRASVYGQEMARKLAYQLARLGVPVISGLARGIDTQAHKGALQAKGRTVAIIGCGLDIVYPAENKKLAEEIVATGGAVVTEFPFGVPPDRQTFPMRNRIISGWSVGVVVVEANLTSGALITASLAAEQGRQVFAVPGRADSPLSRGTHKLIKDGAKLTEDLEDILGEFEYLLPKTESKPVSVALSLTESESKVLEVIGEEEVTLDEIIQRSHLTTACVSATLLALEMKHLVRQLPGKVFAKRSLN